jgi:hypothetical protein
MGTGAASIAGPRADDKLVTTDLSWRFEPHRRSAIPLRPPSLQAVQTVTGQAQPTLVKPCHVVGEQRSAAATGLLPIVFDQTRNR